MSRIIINLIRLCLLCMLPCLTWAQSLTQYEYWFDDDFNGRVSGSLSGTDDIFKSSISTDQLDNGIHKFCFRAKQSDGKYSAITSSLFLKRPSAQNSVVEYWFDDNFEQRESMNISSTEEEQELSFDLRDNTKYPMGFHKLNMRLNIEGEGVSAVYSAEVLKLSAGKATQLEYWVDDDLANRKTISGSVASDGYIFSTELDLSDITPGYHLLHCRAVSGSKRTVSAVTTTPVMVKLRDNSEGATMLSYTIAIDEGAPIEFPVVNKREIVTIPHTIDTRSLSIGEHTLKASFKNSLGVSSKLEQPFTVVALENPSIVLKGWCSSYNNWLHMDFNSIPNDISYTVIERDADGNERAVYKRVASFYPDTIKALPDPITSGVATYYVIATYLDKYNHEQEVKSNEVTLNNFCPPAASLYGCIVGRIQFNANNTLLSPHKHLYVNFSDGNKVEKVKVNPNGTFEYDKIPFGTTMSLSIDDDDYYKYESISVSVDKDTRYKVQVIKATAHDDVSVNINNENVDLIATVFKWEERTFNFEIVNTSSSYQTFSGVIEMIAFKSKKDHDAVFDPTKPYYHAGSVYIKDLNYGKTTSASITLENLPKLKKNEHFTFYFVTQRDEQSMSKQFKQLVFEDKRFTNPMTLPITPNPTIDDVEFPDIDSFIMEVIKIMKDNDNWNGPLYKELKLIAEKYDKYKKDDDYLALSTYLNTGLLFNFCQDLKKAYKNVSKSTKPIREFYEDMRNVMTFSEKKPFDNFIVICKKIFKLYKEAEKIGGVSTNPFLEIYSLYLDAAEHAVESIENYQNVLTDLQLGDIFYNGKITFKIKMYKEKDWLIDLNPTYKFTSKQIADNINSIQICLENEAGQVEVASYSATGTDDSIELILTRIKSPTPYDHGYRSKRFWMEIIWKNGRFSQFPLYDEFTEWDRNGQDVRNITLTLRAADYGMNKIYIDY